MSQAWGETPVEIRRDLHRQPELGFMEFRTASRVAAELDAVGWDMRLGAEAMDPAARLGLPDGRTIEQAYSRALELGGDIRFMEYMRGGLTAVVGMLKGDTKGPTVAIRLDMDALPITESLDPSHRPAAAQFASAQDGVMHACAHDGHVAMGVGVARELADRDFPGVIKLVFQPAEEGGRGAAAVVAAGSLEDVDLLVCAHIGLGLGSGSIASRVGGLLANSKLRAQFFGRAAHAAAAPHEGRHALLAAATAALGIHALPSFPGGDTRVNVGMLAGGASSNVIPDYASMLLETRAQTGDTNRELQRRVTNVIDAAAAMYEVSADVEVVGSAPTAHCSELAAQRIGAAATHRGLSVVPEHYVGVSDDGAAMMQAVHAHGGAATYCTIGAELAGPHHHPQFDFDEAVLRPSIEVFTEMVRNGGAS